MQQAAAATAAPIRAAAPSGSSAPCAYHITPAAATAAPIRAAAPSGGSVYCACHATSSRGHGGANPRRVSFRKLCALRLPHNTSCGHGGANPRRSSFRRLCVLRLPCNKQPRPRRRQSAPQLLQEALCTAPATQQAAAATAAPIGAAAPSGGVVYCACHATTSRHGGANPRRSSFGRLCVLPPATQQVGVATAAPIRAAAPSRGFVHCAV